MLHGDQFKYINEFKYLGVLINPSLSDINEIMKRVGKMYASGNTIISKFKNCNVATTILMFKMYCGNVYGCPLWTNYNIVAYKRIKVAHNVFRILLKERRGPKL